MPVSTLTIVGLGKGRRDQARGGQCSWLCLRMQLCISFHFDIFVRKAFKSNSYIQQNIFHFGKNKAKQIWRILARLTPSLSRWPLCTYCPGAGIFSGKNPVCSLQQLGCDEITCLSQQRNQLTLIYLAASICFCRWEIAPDSPPGGGVAGAETLCTFSLSTSTVPAPGGGLGTGEVRDGGSILTQRWDSLVQKLSRWGLLMGALSSQHEQGCITTRAYWTASWEAGRTGAWLLLSYAGFFFLSVEPAVRSSHLLVVGGHRAANSHHRRRISVIQPVCLPLRV